MNEKTDDNQILFSAPCLVGNEHDYVCEALENGRLAGDGKFTERCSQKLSKSIGVEVALTTPSGTHALELAALLINIQIGDEVILPSFTFSSTANAFVLRGAKLVFVDIRKDTMNLDEALVEEAITRKTKAIIAVHYAGVACEMDELTKLASKHDLWLIEDAAQAYGSRYKGLNLGSIGHCAALSFHETKNIQCGEGGALLTQNRDMGIRAEIIREKVPTELSFSAAK